MTNNQGENCKITVTPYIIPFIKNLKPEDIEMIGGKESIRNEQGFYIYRNNRLIIWGNWLHMVGMNDLYKNARIEVNIPNSLDDIWEVDVKKSTASIPGFIRQSLFGSVKKAIGSSKRIYQKRGENTSKEKGYSVVWNVSEERDTYDFKINREMPLLIQLESDLQYDKKVLLKALLENIEDNLPKMKIYSSVADSKDAENENELEKIKEQLNDILQSIENSSLQEKRNFVSLLFQSEPYCKFINLYEEIMEELKQND